MSIIVRLRSLLEALTRRTRLEREMDDEMRFHVDSYATDLRRRGIDAEEAQRRALLEFGARQHLKEECRQARGLRWFDEVTRNLRYSLRVLGRAPGFTLAVITTLALCAGANTAIFSVVDAVFFRPFPYQQPERLGELVTKVRMNGDEQIMRAHDGQGVLTFQQLRTLDIAAAARAFAGVNLVTGQGARYVNQHRVSARYFGVLGVTPQLGREFSAAEDVAGGPAVVILSHRLFTSLFPEPSAGLGSALLLRGEPHTVIGVMPANFRAMVAADVWTPLRATATGEGGGQNFAVIGRLRPGYDWPAASAEVASLSAQALQRLRLPADVRAEAHVMPLQDSRSQAVRTQIYLLWAAVGVVFLIGCLNVAGLILARASARGREIGTRMAIGGGRAAVLRQLATESFVLALAGGLAGLGVGYAGIRLLTMFATRFGVWQELRLDLRVIAVMLSVSILTTLLFSLAPMIEATRLDIRRALAAGASRTIAGARAGRMRRGLVTFEIALSVVLLVSAGLLIRTLLNLREMKPGFDGAGVLTASVSLQDARYRTTERVNWLLERTLERIRTIPGVESAAAGLHVPYQRWLNSGLRLLDGPAARTSTAMTTANYVTTGYFETLRIPLISGRGFRESDRMESKPVAIVNQEFVRKYFKDQPAIGSHLELRMDGVKREVIGVVGDVQQRPGFAGYGPIGPVHAVYIPARQYADQPMSLTHTWFSPRFVVKSRRDSESLAPLMHSAISAVDPMLPFSVFENLAEVRDQTLTSQRFNAGLLGLLAALALSLAAVGLYGLIAGGVVERTREMGVRLALGASSTQVIFSAARPGIMLAAIGAVAGALLAAGAARSMQSLLYGVEAADPTTIAAVVAVLLIVAACASLIPALRLLNLDPAHTLREE